MRLSECRGVGCRQLLYIYQKGGLLQMATDKVVLTSENLSDDARLLLENILKVTDEYFRAEHSKKIKIGIALKKQRQASETE